MRWVLRLIGVLALIVGVTVGSLLLLPGDRIARIAADQVRAQTGRELVISGDIKITLWPVIGISTGPVTFSNASWSDAGPMFAADRMSIGVNTAGLFGGDVRVTKIEASSPTIRLEQRADGRANWLFGASPTATDETVSTSQSTTGKTPRTLILERLDVVNARLIYDAEGRDTFDLAGVDLSLDWPDPDGPARFDATAMPAGQPVRIQAEIDKFAAWIKGPPQAATADISGPGGNVHFSGVAGLLGELAGTTTITTPDTGAFLNALGLGPFDVPQGLGRSADVVAKVTLTRDGRLALRDAKLDLDGNLVTGAADVTLGDVAQVTAQLRASALDLSAISGAGQESDQGAGGANTGVSGWSTTPIDASGLGTFNGDISFEADSVRFGELQLGATRLLTRVDRARAVFEIREMQAYQGQVTGEFVLNNRSGLSVGGKMAGRGVELNGVLAAMAGITRLSGKSDLELSFLGSGNSVDQIMKSLSGQGNLQVGRGVITGLDLDRLMRSGTGGGGTTVFDSLTATMAMTEGNLVNDDLLLLLPNFRAEGSGRVGLGQRDLDYLFTPSALRETTGSGLAIPVRIKGPWASLRITPDVEAAINLNLAEERKQLENEAEQEMQRVLEQELGVTPKEGQSVEDAVQDKVEDELKRGLLKLLE